MHPFSSSTAPRPLDFRKDEEVSSYFAMNGRAVQGGHVFVSLHKCESCTVVANFPRDGKKVEAVEHVFHRPSYARRSVDQAWTRALSYRIWPGTWRTRTFTKGLRRRSQDTV